MFNVFGTPDGDWPNAALAFYDLTPLRDPLSSAHEHRECLLALAARGRVYLSRQGINAQVSLPRASVAPYLTWIATRHGIASSAVRLQPVRRHPFSRLAVKVRPQLVALDCDVSLERRARHLDPIEWQEILRERDSQTAILDIRNQIEWDLGRFEGARAPERSQFRQFRDLDSSLSDLNRSARILMYCTGGIRCEFASALLSSRGYQNLYQLRGGVLNYAASVGVEHWSGKLFVFDDRLALDIGSPRSTANCQRCQSSADGVYNCADMDCNALYLSCERCWRAIGGCCHARCAKAPRRRSIADRSPQRPFERKRILETTATSASAST